MNISGLSKIGIRNQQADLQRPAVRIDFVADAFDAGGKTAVGISRRHHLYFLARTDQMNIALEDIDQHPHRAEIGDGQQRVLSACTN